MSGLTATPQITRSGRNLISKLMLGVAGNGVSHVAVGSGTGGAYFYAGANPRVGNNFEITGYGYQPVVLTVHNDFPIFNTSPNGVPGAFYFIEQANVGADIGLSLGTGFLGGAVLKQSAFNHLWLVHTGTSGPYGIGEILNYDSQTAIPPAPPDQYITYIGYVECDNSVKTFYNPARMFNELGRTTSVQLQFIGDRAVSGAPSISQPSLPDAVSAQPNPSILVTAPFSLGVTDTIREVAILGDNGNDILAWMRYGGTPITPGEGIFVQWALAF